MRHFGHQKAVLWGDPMQWTGISRNALTHDTPALSSLPPAPPPHGLPKTLEELLALRRQVDTLRAAQEEATQQAELLRDENTGQVWGVCVCS